jgi:hypothetical protein
MLNRDYSLNNINKIIDNTSINNIIDNTPINNIIDNTPINNIIDNTPLNNIISKSKTIAIEAIKKLSDVVYIDNFPEFNNLPFISNGVVYNFPDIIPFVEVNGNKYLLNVIRSPIPPPEKNYSSFLAKLHYTPSVPPSLNLFKAIGYNNRIKSQSGPTCTANSTACMKEYQAFVKNNYNKQFSPYFIYHLRENKYTEGQSLGGAMSVLQKYGACPNENYEGPYGEFYDTEENYILSTKYKIESYSLIYMRGNPSLSDDVNTTINNIKTALYLHGPCLISTIMYSEQGKSSNNNYDGRVWDRQSGSASGAHCMVIVGYDVDNGFIVRNSWGPQWPNVTMYTGIENSAGKGQCWLPYSDILADNGIIEIWTVNDIFQSPEPIISKRDVELLNNRNNKKLHILFIIPIVILIMISYIYKSQILKFFKL